MTPGEIVAEYKQAASPMKQIEILADENVCSKQDIVKILLEAGEKVPGQYLPKEKKAKASKAEPVPKPAPKDPVGDMISRLAFKAAALDAIGVIVDSAEGEADVTREVRAIVTLVRKMEEVENDA